MAPKKAKATTDAKQSPRSPDRTTAAAPPTAVPPALFPVASNQSLQMGGALHTPVAADPPRAATSQSLASVTSATAPSPQGKSVSLVSPLAGFSPSVSAHAINEDSYDDMQRTTTFQALWPMDCEVVPPCDLRHLQTYRYSAVDHSLLSKYVLQRFWNWAVELVPLTMAPNTLTFLACIASMSGPLVHFYYRMTAPVAPVDPATSAFDFIAPSDNIPAWVFLFTGVTTFIYQTLDALDGKQARRTRATSPLGELFDHGCDALYTPFMQYTACVTFGMSAIKSYVMTCVLGFVLFTSIHEQYCTGTFELPIINGPVEGLVFSIIAFTATTWLPGGPRYFQVPFMTASEYWSNKTPSASGAATFIPAPVSRAMYGIPVPGAATGAVTSLQNWLGFLPPFLEKNPSASEYVVPLFQTPGDIAWAVSVFTAVLTLVNGLINIYTKKRSSAAAAAAAAASTAAAAPEATPVVKNTHWRQKGDPKRGAPWYEHLPRRAVSSFLTHCVIFAIFISLPAVVGIANQWRGAGSTRNFVLVHTFEFNAVYGVLFSFAATRLTVSRLCHSEVVLVPKMLLLSLVAPLLVYVGIASDVIRTPRALAWIRARAIEPVVAVTLPALTAAFAGVPAHDPAAFFAQASQAVSSLTVTDCVTSLTAALARAAEATSNGIFGAATNTFCGVPWLYWLGGVILLAYCHFLIAVFHQFASYLRVNVLTMTTLQKRQVLVEIVARREQRQAKRAGQQGTPAPSPGEAQAHLHH